MKSGGLLNLPLFGECIRKIPKRPSYEKRPIPSYCQDI
jgi:hypothetical protein